MSLRKIAGLFAGFALTVGLIGNGVMASFSDSVTANENISVGTFQCLVVQPSDGLIAGDGKSVTYTAPTINSSAAGSAPFSFSVQNTGSIDAVLTVSASPVSAPWSIMNQPFAAVPLAAGATHVYNTGIQWTELDNSNLGQTGTVTWTVSCNEVPPTPAFDVAYYAVNNGGAQFAAGTWVRSTSPIASTVVTGGGTATQTISSGSVNLAITGGGPYSDNGFYVPLGTIASLASSGYTVTGTGSQFGTNVYFDVDNDASFFGWTGNSLSSIIPDTYGLGPTSVAGTLAVTGSSTYAMTCNGAYGNYSLTTLATTGCTEGVSPTTQVAVWVGITSTGAALSTTITSAP